MSISVSQAPIQLFEFAGVDIDMWVPKLMFMCMCVVIRRPLNGIKKNLGYPVKVKRNEIKHQRLISISRQFHNPKLRHGTTIQEEHDVRKQKGKTQKIVSK